MAEKEMDRIAAEIEEAHPGARVAFRHRVGSLGIGEVAVAVAAAAPHRDEAFAACRAGIEAIKARVPIWKKEFGPDGSSWVEPCGDPFHVPYGNPDSA
jgi:molybdopterin synthase catalytic subunit